MATDVVPRPTQYREIPRLIQLHRWIAASSRKLPFWNALERLSGPVHRRVIAVADRMLVRLPLLRRAEWLLGLDSIKHRSSVIVAAALLFAFWRGLRPTGLGHIGTDKLIYPFMAATSSFNPFLGLCCGIAYGVGDLIQKITLSNDIYGGAGFGNYWGAIFGYSIAYSSLVFTGVVPGVLARAFRRGAHFVLTATQRVPATAEGAIVTQPAWHSWLELGAAMGGAYLGGFVALNQVAHTLEWPAFHLRPVPDVSCHTSEVGILKDTAHPAGGAGAGGTLTTSGTGSGAGSTEAP